MSHDCRESRGGTGSGQGRPAGLCRSGAQVAVKVGAHGDPMSASWRPLCWAHVGVHVDDATRGARRSRGSVNKSWQRSELNPKSTLSATENTPLPLPRLIASRGKITKASSPRRRRDGPGPSSAVVVDGLHAAPSSSRDWDFGSALRNACLRFPSPTTRVSVTFDKYPSPAAGPRFGAPLKAVGTVETSSG